jgi:single-stranded DNA-binding protein
MDTITILGNIGKEPIIASVNGNEVININVGVSIGYGESKATTWYEVAFWNKNSINYIKQAVAKGSIVLVVGKYLRLEEYQHNGTTKSKLKLMGTDIKVLPKLEAKQSAISEDIADLNDEIPF